MSGLADMTRARNRELEGVDVQPLVICVGEETDKIVLLQALRVVLVVYVGAGRTGVPKMAKSQVRRHTELNHGPIRLQPIALPLSYIPNTGFSCVQECPL